MENLTDQLRILTPQQKLEFLEPLLKKKKGKEKKQILTLIKEVKQEQSLLEESIRSLEKKRPIHEDHPEEPLESIVEEEATTQAQKKEQPLQLYGSPVKPGDMYGTERLETKYLSSEEREKDKYKSQPEFPSGNILTSEERNLAGPEKRLEKEKKKYETGSN